MPKFTHHIFICCNQRKSGGRPCCDPKGNEALRDALKRELKKQGAGTLVRANRAGCLDQCELGPCLVIYPQAIWYGGVTIKDVPRIVEETILQGRVIPELLIDEAQLNPGKQ